MCKHAHLYRSALQQLAVQRSRPASHVHSTTPSQPQIRRPYKAPISVTHRLTDNLVKLIVVVDNVHIFISLKGCNFRDNRDAERRDRSNVLLSFLITTILTRWRAHPVTKWRAHRASKKPCRITYVASADRLLFYTYYGGRHILSWLLWHSWYQSALLSGSSQIHGELL